MMTRPRPRIEGKPAARFAGRPVKSNAPKDARLVPEKLSSMDNPRATAAKRMLGNPALERESLG